MKITLNNKEAEFNGFEQLTVSELFKLKKYTFPHIIVKKNGVLIKKDQYSETTILDGDKVEAIHLIGGG